MNKSLCGSIGAILCPSERQLLWLFFLFFPVCSAASIKKEVQAQNFKGKMCHFSWERHPNTKRNSINSDSNSGETPSMDNGMRFNPVANRSRELGLSKWQEKQWKWIIKKKKVTYLKRHQEHEVKSHFWAEGLSFYCQVESKDVAHLNKLEFRPVCVSESVCDGFCCKNGL